MKRTKIICTIGPATEQKQIIIELIKAGMNAARLNFSHGTYPHHAELISRIRAASKKTNRPIAIIQDLQGPRLRLGDLPQDGITVKSGDTVALVPEKRQRDFSIPADMVALPTREPLGRFVNRGDMVLIKDGLVKMKVTSVRGDAVVAEVLEGDVLTSNRGINLPQVKIAGAIITAKDRADIRFGIKHEVDWLALSFVRSAKDIQALRRLLPGGAGGIKIIAKIERKEAVEHFDEILEVADAIMIARGDLGIEMPKEKIPLIQKGIIVKCRQAGKPVIVATQMLESMTVNPEPTRAEVSDVANAVIDHTDAVMLSGETATGKFPIKTCQVMARIIEETESSRYDNLGKSDINPAPAASAMIAHMVKMIVDEDEIEAVVVMSSTGKSAQIIAAERPEVSIIGLTQNEVARRQMALSWGVEPHLVARQKSLDNLIKETVKLVKKELKISSGEKIIIATGHPTGPHGSLNLIKIHTI